MADLATTWLGIELATPLVLGASGLSSTAEGVRKAAAGGFGAVVLKSLFEEQLAAEVESIESSLDVSHPEAALFFGRSGVQEGLSEYAALVRDSRKAGIPVIASINCVGESSWGDYAERVAEAGADAIELNIGFMPVSTSATAVEVEERLYAIVREAASHSNLPLAVKLGPAWSSLANVASGLAALGVRGLVLFNRFYNLDVDLGTMQAVAGHVRSSGDEYHDSLRWISILHDRVGCDFAASSGVHESESVLKLVAAGANAVQICSAVYSGGYGIAAKMNAQMSARLDALGFDTLAGLKGRFSQWSSGDPQAHVRLQYVKALTGIS